MPHPHKMSEQDPRPILNQIAGPRLSGTGSRRAPSREAHGAFVAIVVENRVRWDYVAPIPSLHLLALLAFVPWRLGLATDVVPRKHRRKQRTGLPLVDPDS